MPLRFPLRFFPLDFPLGQSLVMDFRLGQSLVVALLQYYFGRRLGNRFYMGRRFWGSFLFWVDHEGRPYVIRSILVDGWGCHYGIRFNQLPMLLPPATWTLCCALTENSENDNTITTYIRTLYLL